MIVECVCVSFIAFITCCGGTYTKIQALFKNKAINCSPPIGIYRWAIKGTN